MRRQGGFSLLEMIIASGLIGVAAMMTASYLTRVTQSTKYEQIRATQAAIVDRLHLLAANPDTLRASADNAGATIGNLLLSACVDPTQVCPADATSAAKQKTFDLWIQNGKAYERLAGTAANPVPYSDTGDRDCFPPGPSCRFGGVASFWATCPAAVGSTLPAATCNLPLTIHVRFQIVPMRQPTEGASLPSYPKDFDGDKTAYATAVDVSEILQKRADACPPDAAQVGYDQYGRAVCRCYVEARDAAGKVIVDGSGRPKCGAQECPKTASGEATTMVGYDADGRIRCADPVSSDKCWQISLQGDGDCGVGGRLVRIDYGKCYVIDGGKKGKGAKDVVECENDKGLCCKGIL